VPNSPEFYFDIIADVYSINKAETKLDDIEILYEFNNITDDTEIKQLFAQKTEHELKLIGNCKRAKQLLSSNQKSASVQKRTNNSTDVSTHYEYSGN